MLDFIYYPVSFILWCWHKVFGFVFGEATAISWILGIIFLTFTVRGIMFKPFVNQVRSMKKMQDFAPEMKKLQKKYANDRQRQAQEMQKLQREHGFNPLGGCLPMLIQIPVFFALYYVLLESVELRQAPFFGWIQNLSAPDPYFILPILNAIQMFLTQRMSPAAPGMDPMQARMMKVMPLMFAVLFLFFPAGLVLYYTVNGGLSLLQQWIINRRMELADKAR